MRITQEYLDEILNNGRRMLKPDWKLWNPKKTDEALGVKFEQTCFDSDKEYHRIKLDLEGLGDLAKKALHQCIADRESIRAFNDEELTLKELSYLLVQSVGYHVNKDGKGHFSYPSAGNRYCLNTYVFVNRVEELEDGLYLYLPKEEELILISNKANIGDRLSRSIFHQMYNCALAFIWTAQPYIMEYRYSVVSHKMIALEAGHACQNLYLATEALNCGCCAIGAYEQDKIDKLLQLDSDKEFTIYLAVVGKK